MLFQRCIYLFSSKLRWREEILGVASSSVSFFFDSLSCLVSPISFFLNILPFGCQYDGARDGTLSHSAERKQLTHCCQALGTLGDESNFSPDVCGKQKKMKKLAET